MKTYHIIGAGIAGLSFAKFIKQKDKNAKTIIYEANRYCGGRCYSFHDKKLQTEIDNATHVILKANKNARALIKDAKFQTPKINLWKNKNLIIKSIFNTEPKDVPFSCLFTVLRKLFPLETEICFSQNDLSEKLINPLKTYADEINLSFVLKNFQSEDNKITKLVFDKREIKIGGNDVVISALDAYSCNKIFHGPKFEFNRIINIFYRTGMKISLPDNRDFMAVDDENIDWIFCNKDTLSVTLSNAQTSPDPVRIWKRICKIRGREAAFLPGYRILKYPRATIKQDAKNNARRNFKPAYDNLKIIGDWTMRNWPCCIEAAIISAKKASRRFS